MRATITIHEKTLELVAEFLLDRTVRAPGTDRQTACAAGLTLGEFKRIESLAFTMSAKHYEIEKAKKAGLS